MEASSVFHPEGPTFKELTIQALSSTTRGYDLIAPKFEHTPFRTPDGILKPLMALIGSPGSIDDGLDVCCGTGAGMQALRPLCRRSIAGVDLSDGMLQQARARMDERPELAPATLTQRDALDLGFDAEFDVATCFGAFGHILPEDQDRFIAGIFKALRPGGRFVFVTRQTPGLTSRTFWVYHGFNAVMKVRNAVLKPPFIMYYLIFTLPRALEVLTRQGFQVEVHDIFSEPYHNMRAVVATRPRT